MNKEVYIIRHGQTELNRQGIVQGRGVNTDLNDTGRAQAAAFFARYQGIAFDHIYTSSLKRTHQTVQGFIDAGISWTPLADLDELAWGKWEGQPDSEASRHAFKEMAEQWQQGHYDARFDGGESPNQVMHRLQNAMAAILANTHEKRILICMHGRAMRLLLCHLMNKPMAEMADFPHQNTTLYRLHYTGAHFELIESNNIDHLENIDLP